MNLIVIDTGQKRFLEQFLNSLKKTSNFKPKIIKERESREATLNIILEQYGNEDILVFGDDIIFTKGWLEFLMANKERGDIIGFSMLYPETDKIQDTGYDLVSIDNQVTLKPENRGKKKTEIKKFNFRECSSLNGCALFIKKRVIEKIPIVSLNGQNRWGEFLYINEAKKKRFKVIVLGHYLYHRGKSTKINPNKLLSSESYLLERDMWKDIVKKHISQNQIKIQFKKILSDQLKNILLSNKKILFYGAGTVSEFIYKELKENLNPKFIDFCSGLFEEKGKNFYGQKIKFYKEVQFRDYDIIVITVFQKEKEIFDLIKNYIDKQKVYCITKETINNTIILSIKPL